MATRYVPKAKFDGDVMAAKVKVEDFINTFYNNSGIGPTFEEIRDGLEMDNDVVSCVLTGMIKDGTKIVKVSV